MAGGERKGDCRGWLCVALAGLVLAAGACRVALGSVH